MRDVPMADRSALDATVLDATVLDATVLDATVFDATVRDLVLHAPGRCCSAPTMHDATVRGLGTVAILRRRCCGVGLRARLSLRRRYQRRTKQRNGAAP
jgi:hypothetical protein